MVINLGLFFPERAKNSNLIRIREFMLERNRVFEGQAPGALDEMIRINGETMR